MAAPPPDPRVDDLRQRLRSLGYLDAGVDRFVLGAARGTRGATAIALLASLRIGVLAVLLLGPAAAIGLSARLPGLVVGPRDAIVIALYLGLFFGVAVAVAALVASMLVLLVARTTGPTIAQRGRMLSRVAGVIVTLACLSYLTLWWQTVIAGLGWSAPVWTASALAVAVAISLLLGHAVTVSSAAVIVASAGATAASERVATVSRWATLGAALVAFGGAVLLLTWSAGSAAAPAAPPALTVVPSGLRVRVIAIDGFDPRVFETLSSAGRLPALTSAFGGARAALESRAGEAGDPARVWTTMATGQPPAVHGVQGLETRRVAGVQGTVPLAERSPIFRTIRGATDLVRLTRPAIASGSERRAKTLWEIAAGAGLRTAVVNWWATWPARGDAGIVLSDRATLRLEHGGPLDGELAPESLYEPLRQRWPGLKARATTLASAALDGAIDDAVRPLLQRSAELDALQIVLLSEVAAGSTDLAVVYLPGLDIAQHALLGSDQRTLGASALGARLAALETYYAALDRLIAPLLSLGPDDLAIVVTEPGRVAGDGGTRLAALGRSVRAGRAIAGTQTSVVPTILLALGVPLARDLAGAPLVDLFDDAFVTRYPPRFVATYGSPAVTATPRSGQPLDQEMIDRLRSLGYVR